MTDRGYLVIAQNSGDTDYIRMAYALALSIKKTQSVVKSFAIAVVEGTVIPAKYKKVFDFVVTIPWTDHAAGSDWKIENKWKYLYMTPFAETVILDADMIFTSDVSYWWDIMADNEMVITKNVRNYKNEVVTSDAYRKVFTSNNLPNVYTAFAYFKKTSMVSEIFKVTELIFNNWETFYYEYLDDTRPKFLSGDVAFALAIKLLGYENEVFLHGDEVPTFVHMKSRLQNVPDEMITDYWHLNIPSYLNAKSELKVGNFTQVVPFHYHQKDWLTDDILSKLES